MFEDVNLITLQNRVLTSQQGLTLQEDIVIGWLTLEKTELNADRCEETNSSSFILSSSDILSVNFSHCTCNVSSSSTAAVCIKSNIFSPVNVI